LCIPILNFNLPFAFFNPIEALSNQIPQGEVTGLENTPAATKTFSIVYIYLSGLVVAIGLFLLKFAMLKRRLGDKFSFKNKSIEIAETDGLNAYSFYNTIYIGKELESNSDLKSHVIAHERAHIEGRHSLDLVFFELLQCFYWFNPFSYFYTKSIKIQHEYIADDYALKITSPRNYERSLLELTLSKFNTSLVSSFSEHPIQKRLKMIQKLNSNVMKKLKPLFVLPVIGILVIGFACSQEPDADLIEPELMIEIPVEVSEVPNTMEFEVENVEERRIELDVVVEGDFVEEEIAIGEVREVANVKSVKRIDDTQMKLSAETEAIFEEIPVEVTGVRRKSMKTPADGTKRQKFTVATVIEEKKNN